MTREETKSCIGTIKMLQRLAYNIHGVMDVIDADNCKKIIKALEQEPCEDCVRRQEVMDCFKKWQHTATRLFDFEKELFSLPSVNPQEPKTGHWIEVTNGRGGHECDICHEYAPSYKSGDEYLTKYCPNCGARMEGDKR